MNMQNPPKNGAHVYRSDYWSLLINNLQYFKEFTIINSNKFMNNMP